MKFVINRSDAIGDLILTTPMAQAIKESFPSAHITFIISPKCQDILKHHPYVDEVIVLNPKEKFLKRFLFLFKKLKGSNFYFFVGGSSLPNLVAALLRIPFRGGIKSRWPTFLLLNKGIRQRRSEVLKHEVEYNLDLLKPLNIPINDYSPKILLKNKERNPFEKEFIVVHPGMTGHTLNWPSEYYAQFIEKMEMNFPDRFLYVISHTPSDEPYLKDVRNLKLGEKIHFFDGSKKGLENYMGILSYASLFLGPATGTTHIANALGVKQIAIYSPIKVQSAFRWSPFEVENSLVLAPKVNCPEKVHCRGETCPDFECMRKIEVNKVIEAAKVLLGS
ncbi:MAG: glycosyltransferase family 9 protein [Bacteriovoracales bacterium]